MDVFTYAELITGLLAAVGTGMLVLTATSRAPKALHDEIAHRVEQSIALLDDCKDAPSR
jgi:hypothetical protein